MRCLRCQNEEERYFFNDRGIWYCRRCIAFGRMDVGKKPKRKKGQAVLYTSPPVLRYALTFAQKRAVEEMIAHLKCKKDVLIYAATGAGKTEIAMMALHHYLCQGKKVGFAIARRQVVLEIRDRLQEAFPSLRVIAVCEGYTTVTDGDIVVCTMHQLYRFTGTFSFLVLDEVDAFPYRDNRVLECIAMQACIGEKVYLSATPDEVMHDSIKRGLIKKVELFMRPHRHPLVVPQVVRLPYVLQLFLLLLFLHKRKRAGKPCLVFVSTIARAESLAKWMKLIFQTCALTSQTVGKDEILRDFKAGNYPFLICTTVLERGVTLPGIDVMVLESDHAVFQEASLIQIAGRVGRSMTCPDGTVLFLCSHQTKAIRDCVFAIKKMNEDVIY